VTLLFLRYGRNPLIIRYLLQHGARIDAEDANGCTPLHWAAYQNLPHVITLLLAAGASNEGQNQTRGQLLPAHCFSFFLLFSFSDINKADSGGLTPLHRASSRGNWHCVNTLLEHAADP
jgi:ankyrin repeat protein